MQTEQSESGSQVQIVSENNLLIPPLQSSQQVNSNLLYAYSLTRRDSSGSVKSLVSYPSVRESLGKMHAYVDRVSKLDTIPPSKKHSTNGASQQLDEE